MDRLDRIDSDDDVIAHGEKSYNLRWVAVDKNVLIVKVTSEEVNHGEYIGAVKGEDYDVEAISVVVNGSLLSSYIGEAYFYPDNSVPYRILPGQDFFDGMHSPIVNRPHENPPGILEVFSLDKHVIAVAAGNVITDVAAQSLEGKWTAFVGAVKGEDHWAEAQGVISTGSRIPLEFAEVAFEELGKATRYGYLKYEGVEDVDRSKLFSRPTESEW